MSAQVVGIICWRYNLSHCVVQWVYWSVKWDLRFGCQKRIAFALHKSQLCFGSRTDPHQGKTPISLFKPFDWPIVKAKLKVIIDPSFEIETVNGSVFLFYKWSRNYNHTIMAQFIYPGTTPSPTRYGLANCRGSSRQSLLPGRTGKDDITTFCRGISRQRRDTRHD